NAGSVVPAPVEDQDLARCRKVFNVTLPKHLRFLPIRGSRKRYHAKHARAHAVGDGLDRSALARRVPTFEQDDDACSRLSDHLLEVAKFDLQLVDPPLINFAFLFGLGLTAVRSF